MRKIICLLLASLLLLAGCAQPPGEDHSAYAGIVADTRTWYEEFTGLPIANENMTEQELRALCVEAFHTILKLQ